MNKHLTLDEQIEKIQLHIDYSLGELFAGGHSKAVRHDVRVSAFFGWRLFCSNNISKTWDEVLNLMPSNVGRESLRDATRDFKSFYLMVGTSLDAVISVLISQEFSKHVPQEHLEVLLSERYPAFRKASEKYNEAIDDLYNEKKKSKAIETLTDYCKKHLFDVYKDIDSKYKSEALIMLMLNVKEFVILDHPHSEELLKVIDKFISRKVAYKKDGKFGLFSDYVSPKFATTFQESIKKEVKERYLSEYVIGKHLGMNFIHIESLSNEGMKKAEELTIKFIKDLKDLGKDKKFQSDDPLSTNVVAFNIEQVRLGRQVAKADIHVHPEPPTIRGSVAFDVRPDNSELSTPDSKKPVKKSS
ncbi:MAG: hypothetical protein CME70_03180 [Halobacteriovorax sp.]|nr:hypothetical protein [Halobacteriovorax sp.]MBK22986.1 hypothetical protein [Halobacteriovorax sp.]|tara:strand:- start:11280 stop:12353 length:1074 start_codon:yes stop_codon:yes gene_type:complete